ncbi:flagellar basal body-associated FliL family protein [Solidesulfovibrio sp.]|uniref:flagellar basal body-associated FliL family protein n=1 Tax=Solidesulfovibrio sp. TaxID=2910990 RepID=UPI000ED012DB|nr:flagellar basal body-associated FliL family protein [Solidesulfovibrio sp.]MEA5088379.1 flagellar basal body-associated FliL family protein [Solidesulfovibrio sp.]HCR13395.1 flagellar basal body protein FliL [Desulfovibrio sp.]HML59467.1 flagellar basal body-associated FliL family protein [Solidesulfovibrio sp.]
MVADDSLDSQVKAKLDDSELSDDLPKALQKVDLDLDDAPFLEDEAEEETPPPAEEAAASPFDEPEAQAKPSRKKLFIIIGAVAFVLVAGVAAYFLFLKKTAPPPSPQETSAPAEEAPPPPVAPTPPPEPPAPKREIVMPMEPFLVELTDAGGRTRFLTIRFTAVTQEPSVELEFKRNRIVVRDAVYYYLKNKNLAFLTDKNNAEALKKDVLSVINQFVGAQPLDNLLIEDYLVK